MTPEQKARQRIDQFFAQAGWLVQDYGSHNIAAAPGVAIREFPLTTGHADYLLYSDAKVIGVAEAKKESSIRLGIEADRLEQMTRVYQFDGSPEFKVTRPAHAGRDHPAVPGVGRGGQAAVRAAAPACPCEAVATRASKMEILQSPPRHSPRDARNGPNRQTRDGTTRKKRESVALSQGIREYP
jgi:hypothetical protein